MGRNPAARGPTGPERPSSSAKLQIEVSPARVFSTVEGNVPPGQAGHLITTFCLMGTGFFGIGGAILSVYVAPHLAVLAFAVLGLAFAIAILIAVCAARGPRKKGKHLQKRPLA